MYNLRNRKRKPDADPKPETIHDRSKRRPKTEDGQSGAKLKDSKNEEFQEKSVSNIERLWELMSDTFPKCSTFKLNTPADIQKEIISLTRKEEVHHVLGLLISKFNIEISIRDKDGNVILKLKALDKWCDIFNEIFTAHKKLVKKVRTAINTMKVGDYERVVLASMKNRQALKQFVDDMIVIKESEIVLSENCDSLIHISARFGWMDQITSILKQTNLISNIYDVLNHKGHDGNTVIMKAIDCRHANIVQALLNCSEVDISLHNNDGDNILHKCAGNGWDEIITGILHDHWDVVNRDDMLNQKGYYGYSVLMRTRKPEIAFELLKYRDVDITIRNNYGCNILHQCAQNGWDDVIQLLLNDYWDIAKSKDMLNQRGWIGSTLVLSAPNWKKKNLVVKLLEIDEVDVTVPFVCDDNLLHKFLENGWEEICFQILNEKCDTEMKTTMLNCKGRSGSTLIMNGARLKKKEAVELLLKYNEVDIKIRDDYGNNILHLCARNGWDDIVKQILTEKLDDGNRDAFLNQREVYGCNVIISAAAHNQKKVVQYLLEYKSVDITLKNSDGHNMLHWCAQHGWEDILKYIVDENYDIVKSNNMLNHKGWLGRSVILSAASSGHKQIVMFLCTFSEVDLMVHDKDGHDLLHWCEVHGWSDIKEIVSSK